MNVPMMGRGFAAALMIAVGFAALSAPPARACFGGSSIRYEIKDLGTLGGASSGAEGINGSGQIVGLSQITASTHYHGYVWDPAGLHDLGTFGGAQSGSRAINNRGDVVGWSNTADNEKHAFYYHDGQMTDLGSLAGSPVDAYGLNDAGVVVGSYINGPYERAFVWSGGTMQDIGTLGGTDSRAFAVNNHGDVVGFSRPTDDSQLHACLWRGGAAIDLGTLGGWASYAYDINDNGKIVGWSLEDPNTVSHAFEWADGQMIDLGTLGGIYSAAFAINFSGLSVGVSTDTYGQQRAVAWQGGVICDLNTQIVPGSGWLLTTASDVNDTGQIAGFGVIQGVTHAFLLTPLPSLFATAVLPKLAFAGASPNPAPGSTTLRFSLATASRATLRIYDVRGRAVRTLADREFGAGPSLVAWDGRLDNGAPAGPAVYWARLVTAGRSFARPITLLR